MNFMSLNPICPRPVRQPAAARELALVALDDEPTAEPEPDFSRCGWFDSSLELAAGLQVVEFVDALPDGLPFELL